MGWSKEVQTNDALFYRRSEVSDDQSMRDERVRMKDELREEKWTVKRQKEGGMRRTGKADGWTD